MIVANPLQSAKNDQLSSTLINYLRDELCQTSLDYSEPLKPLGKGSGGSSFVFKLKCAPEEYSNSLLLRFSPNIPKEGTVQKALNAADYPVPTIHFLCTDTSKLGRPFLIRDYLTGDTLWNAGTPQTIPQKMAENHLKLHEIDATPIVNALKKTGVNEYSYEGIESTDKLIFEKKLFGFDLGPEWELKKDISWLEPVAEWMHDNKPENQEKVVAHGDFHPSNIIVGGGEVKAVIDWQLCRVNDPEYDLASTLVIMRDVWPAFRDEGLITKLVRDYLEIYRRGTSINEEKLEYYLGVKCLTGLCAMEIGFQVFGRPGVPERMVSRIKEVSGIELKRPSRTSKNHG